jgi:electron transfer flavoprotein beta subunit
VAVCVKEVLDPDAVNSYAVAGRLEIGADGKSLSQSAIPRLMNGFDEQAIEAALRLRDAGASFTLAVISAGSDPDKLLKHAAALGAEEQVAIKVDPATLDAHAVALLLARQIEKSGGADVILCGRQASDDDQGVVPALIAEGLGVPVVTVARALALEGGALRITRVTPDGDEIVRAPCPAVVTITNELGEPRYPTAAAKIKARRAQAKVVSPADLGVGEHELAPKVLLKRQFVPRVQGRCEFLEGPPADVARTLLERLHADGTI